MGRRSDARGFVLPLVLVTLATVASVAAAILPQTDASRAHEGARADRAREGHLLAAGVARGVLSLLSPDDPLRAAIERDGRAHWRFADGDLVIEIRPESRKLDLATAEPRALATLLEQLLGQPRAAETLSLVLAERRAGHGPPAPDRLLPMPDRGSSLGATLRDRLTIYGGRTGTEPPQGAAGRPVAFDRAATLYTVRARLAGRPRARADTVMLDAGSGRFVLLDRADLIVDDGDSPGPAE